WDVEIPANVTATVAFPLSGISKLYESGNDIFRKSTGDITFAGVDNDGSLLYTVGSGSYHFSTEGSAIPGGSSGTGAKNSNRLLKWVLGILTVLALAAVTAAVIISVKKRGKK
ncbi:MAG: hypothetical protein J6V14_03780, partial [Clostridia bacterium]|nr:hypothetical protein [Clostridia bacterium]